MADAVLLDVDGTLIDDNLLHVLAWSRAFRRVGREIDASTILHAIGMGGDKLVPHVLGQVDETTAELARTFHGEAYIAGGLISRAEVLPGAAQLLAALRARGVRTALASSAKAEEIGRYTVMLGGDDVVDAIVTKQDVPETKPSPHIFAVALERLGRPKRALVLGDTVWDVAAARELGLPCVCVRTGGMAKKTLEDARPAAVYDGPAAILDDLDRVLALAGSAVTR